MNDCCFVLCWNYGMAIQGIPSIPELLIQLLSEENKKER